MTINPNRPVSARERGIGAFDKYRAKPAPAEEPEAPSTEQTEYDKRQAAREEASRVAKARADALTAAYEKGDSETLHTLIDKALGPEDEAPAPEPVLAGAAARSHRLKQIADLTAILNAYQNPESKPAGEDLDVWRRRTKKDRAAVAAQLRGLTLLQASEAENATVE